MVSEYSDRCVVAGMKSLANEVPTAKAIHYVGAIKKIPKRKSGPQRKGRRGANLVIIKIAALRIDLGSATRF